MGFEDVYLPHLQAGTGKYEPANLTLQRPQKKEGSEGYFLWLLLSLPLTPGSQELVIIHGFTLRFFINFGFGRT